jgi:hypothetical protein
VSTEDVKFKRSKRLLKDENAVRKQVKIARQHNIQGFQSKAEKEPHRFHKHRAMDCGNPRCYLCGNPRRTHKDRLTAQEHKLFQDLETVRDKKSNGLKVIENE